MKIIIVSRQYYPYGMASTNRVHCYTKGFTELGIKTELIIPEATIPYKDKEVTQNKIAEGFYHKTYFRYMSGTTIINKNKWKRPFLDLISRIKTICYILKKTDQKTVLYIWGGGILWSSIMILCGHIKNAKIYTELNELPYGTTKESNKTRLFRYIMLNFIFPHYDGFIVISEALKKLAELYNKKTNCTLKVPILVNTNIARDIQCIPIKTPFIFHSGTLSEQKDGIVKMLIAFSIAKKEIKDLKFYFTGVLDKSKDAQIIQETINKYKLKDDVKFLGYLDEKTLRSYQKSCNLMIIYKYDTLQNKYCFSTKLGEYLAFEKPVILTNIGEAMYYMKNEENAFIAKWEDTNAIANYIITIIKSPELANKIGKNGLKTCEKEFNYFFHAKRMINFFRQKID